MQLVILGVKARSLLASGVGIKGIGSLSPTHSCLSLLRLSLRPNHQLNLPLAGLLDHVSQGLAP